VIYGLKSGRRWPDGLSMPVLPLPSGFAPSTALSYIALNGYKTYWKYDLNHDIDFW
jgi:hypothetical protein